MSNHTQELSAPIEIPFSRGKQVLLILASLAFVVLCVWMFTDADNQTRYDPLLLKVIAIVGVLFFGTAAAVLPFKLLDKRPGLIISSDGITSNLGFGPATFISWKNIERFEIMQIKRTKVLLVHVNNARECVSEASGWRKRSMQWSVNQYGTPYSLSAGSLKIRFDDLHQQLEQQHRSSGKHNNL